MLSPQADCDLCNCLLSCSVYSLHCYVCIITYVLWPQVNADPQHVEQRLRESHLAYYNGLPSYTVTGTNKSSA